ncbi:MULTISPECIES: hypothetical protein [Acinetobacter]|jgi:hypothetical protein|uniref:hypothetical protein n=1 Tax=Acinetobacter TaxID=469 RepID=UPI0002CDE058|nr:MULTISPECIES: hypothetical protein [Acinetobacter]ENU63150.1 hypothetical protein F980_01244 [Acinetobacter lwoffii NIPH 715]ENX21226.1 hypothetical protein F893_01493 [Acinetobacter sp. CIP 102136]ENX29410.1 hypothetical protein F890_02526 [Acinetobacter sp. CIP 64.7]MCU4440397.1 hypothetical protein [Acinetobacter lwoffii]MCU4616017.1 hypothetical protein [Acinetobacter lwoffii]
MLLYFLPFILRLVRFEQFKCRSLTSGEIKISQQVFGNLIDYSRVKIMNHPYLPWQSTHVIMAPSGYIHVRNLNYREDYSRESLSYQALFIHEMAHIYQHQCRINVLLKGAFLQSAYFLSLGKYNPYKYQFNPNKSFSTYNIEQQGDIARDIFLKKIPNIILNPKINR